MIDYKYFVLKMNFTKKYLLKVLFVKFSSNFNQREVMDFLLALRVFLKDRNKQN